MILANYLIAGELSQATGEIVLPLKPYDKLPTQVNSHADMLVSIIGDCIFVYNDYFEENREVFEKIKNFKIVRSKHICKDKYPHDIGLNSLIVGRKIFCNVPYTAQEILDCAKLNGFEIIHVKQGYSCCSTLVIDEKSAITSDVGMYKALISAGIDTMYVDSNFISLDGYNCGFVGGSGGVLGTTVYFFGNIKEHPQFQEVYSFLIKKKLKIECILPRGVSDFGGFKVV